ncbi:hypothetical protein U1Q18_014753, partial [Sarracenia purpurea var. burkii]
PPIADAPRRHLRQQHCSASTTPMALPITFIPYPSSSSVTGKPSSAAGYKKKPQNARSRKP